MALGTMTLVTQTGQKAMAPNRMVHLTVVGDGAYPAGGTPAFKAQLRALLNQANFYILAVIDQSDPTTLSRLEYDHTNDRLFARVRTTGVESAVADQSAVTYRILVILG